MAAPGKYTVIDFHSHLRPVEFIVALENEGISQRNKEGTSLGLVENDTVLTDVPDIYVSGEDAKNLALRTGEMEKSQVDMQVLSVPRSHDYPLPQAIRLCKMINDSYSNIVKEHKDSFYGLASIPMNDVKASIAELDRAINTLELNGICVGGNKNGAPLDDEALFPLYEKINELELPVFIHPGFPPWKSLGLEKYNLAPTIGYQFDTVVAGSHLIHGGILDDFPKIKFVVCHLGAGLTFLEHRLTGEMKRGKLRGSRAKKDPHHYLSSSLYYDCAVGDIPTMKNAFMCTYNLAGADRILFGTDYPWKRADYVLSLRNWIAAGELPEHEKRKILSENAKKILYA
jgi:predicted TIM-barrel fold metal-dependent hydrolase